MRSIQFQGHATLSGQHNFPNHVSRWSDRVYDLTGKYPEVFGQDFGFSGGDDKDSVLGRPSMIQEAIRQYRNGSVIALTWHAVRPTEDEPVTFKNSVQGHLSDYEWQQLLTPGSDLYVRWCQQVDVIAGYLKELQDAGVPVLFRPYHEMNGNWFWWGGRPGPQGSAALYRQIYDRFVHVHHLNNLVWVWNVNSPSSAAGAVGDYYPGPGYADVLTMDIYGAFDKAYYDSMLALAGPTRPIALAEVGAMPSLAVLADQPRWAYFMMWSGMAESSNTPENLQAVFHAPNVADRDDPRLPKPMPAPTVAPVPVSAGSTSAAQALLAKLYQVRGKGILSGEEIQSGAAATENVADKQPAIVSLKLSTAHEQKIIEQVRGSAEAGQLVELRWEPGRPTDDAATGALTDFEWRELLKPGSDLDQRWNGQVDAAAAILRQIEKLKIAILWSPYPGSNTSDHWWGNRPGVEGSEALYQMLFDRLAKQGIHNLVWIWEPAIPAFNGTGNGAWADYYPGALDVDAITLDLNALASGRFRADTMLAAFAGGLPAGVRIANTAPSPDVFANQTGWAWFVLSSEAVATGKTSEAITSLYADPHVLTLSNGKLP